MQDRDIELWAHRKSAIIYAKNFYSSQNDAEDLVSEAFMKILLKNRTENPPEFGDNPIAYIKTTIKNLAIDQKRRDRHDIMVKITDSINTNHKDFYFYDNDNLELEDLYKIINKFNPNMISLIQTKIDGLNTKDAAKKLNMNESAYKTQWFRAKKILIEKLIANNYKIYSLQNY
jgi:RNA polymerase sigma factor (sigma-70 family)